MEDKTPGAERPPYHSVSGRDWWLFQQGITMGIPREDLEAALRHTASPADRIAALNDLAWELRHDDQARALSLAEEAHALSTPDLFLPGLAASLTTRAYIHLKQGRYQEAIARAQEAVVHANNLGDLERKLEPLDILGYSFRYLGDYSSSLESYLEYLEVTTVLGDTKGLATAYNRLGVLQGLMGNLELEANYYQQSLALFREIGDTYGQACILNNISLWHESAGEVDTAIESGLSSLALFESINYLTGQSNMLGTLGDLFFSQGKLENAQQSYQRSLDLARQSGQPYPEAVALRLLGRFQVRSGKPELAIATLKQAKEIALKIDARNKLYEVCENLAEAYEALGDLPQAIQYYRRYQEEKDRVFNEEMNSRFRGLELHYQTESARQKAEFYQTRARELERLREQDRQYFDSLSRMKDELLHTASHDLKSPIAAVNLNLELIRRHGTVSDERGAEYLKRIEGSLSWMEKLITDVLDLAKLETGRALEIKLTSLNPVLEAALADFKSIAQSKSISLELHLEAGVQEVPIDPILLRQALDNLLSNAIKFTPSGGEVTVSAEQSPTSVSIKVHDSGIGIDPQHIPNLFNRFYRINNDRASAVDGTGLGLSIVDRIVTQHGGHVKVTSTPGAGSTFEIVLPLALSESR